MGVLEVFKKIAKNIRSIGQKGGRLPVVQLWDMLPLDYTTERLPKDFAGAFCVSKRRGMDSVFLNDLCEKYPNLREIQVDNLSLEVELTGEKGNSELYTREEMVKLMDVADELREKYDVNLKFRDGFSVDQAIKASTILNDAIDEINSARVKGRELTPMEKYLYAYDIVTQFVYNEDKKNRMNARNLISVLTSDKIVCVGYASLLSEICKGIGIDCRRVNVNNDHSACVVRIKDEAYGVDHEFYSDPCWDCRSNDQSNDAKLAHALMDEELLEHLNECRAKHNKAPYRPKEKLCPMNITKLKAELDKIDNSALEDKDPARFRRAQGVAEEYLRAIYFSTGINMFLSDVTVKDLCKEIVPIVFESDDMLYSFNIKPSDANSKKVIQNCPILNALSDKLCGPSKTIAHPLDNSTLLRAACVASMAHLARKFPDMTDSEEFDKQAFRKAATKMVYSERYYYNMGYFDDENHREGPFFNEAMFDYYKQQDAAANKKH